MEDVRQTQHDRHTGPITWISRGLLVLGLAAGAALAVWWFRAHAAEMATEVGFVFDCHGKWASRQQPGRPLQAGQVLLAGQVIAPEEQQDRPWILIHFRDGTIVDYHQQTTLPSVAATGLVDRVFQRLHHRYFSCTAEAMSRGTQAGLTEAVVNLAGNELDLSEAVAQLRPGEYFLQLEAVLSPAQGSILGRPLSPDSNTLIDLAWDRKSARVQVEKLRPGLYRLVAFRDPERGGIQDECALLLAPSDAYPRLHDLFGRLAQQLQRQQQSDQQAAASCCRALQQAYLSCLADDLQEQSRVEPRTSRP